MLPVVHSTSCLRCQKVFCEERPRHAKNMCRYCYTTVWYQDRASKAEVIPKVTNCLKCNISFIDGVYPNGKKVTKGSKGLCKKCYHKKITKFCAKCGADKGKKGHGLCSVCRIDNGKWKKGTTIPKTISKKNLESIRQIMMRYKLGVNTLVDPFIVADIYLKVFTAGEVGYKNPVGMDIDGFDESSQVIAMLKLLKMTYDKNK